MKRLKSEFPEATIVLNGGIRSTDDVLAHLEWCDGVMLGRGAYQNPFWLSELEHILYGTRSASGPAEVVAAFLDYVQRTLDAGARLHDVTRHMLGLFNGYRGAKAYRRHLSERARLPGAGVEVLQQAVAYVTDARAAA